MKTLASLILGTGRFTSGYRWVIRDHLPGNRVRVAVVAALAVVGALAQAGGIAIVAIAVDYLARPDAAASPRIQWLIERLDEPARAWATGLIGDRAAMLGLFATAVLLLVLTGTWAAYAAIVRTRAMGRSLQLKCSKRCLHILSGTSSLDHPGMPSDQGEFRRLMMRDSIFLSKAFEGIVRSLDPVLRMVVLGLLLLWIEWRLTLVITPFFLVFLPLIYGLGRGVKRDSQRFYESTLIAMFGRVIAAVGLVDRVGVPRVVSPSRRFDEMFEADPQVREYFDEFDRIQLAHERVQFAVGALGSLLIVGALVAGGYLAQHQLLSWGRVLAYMIGLRQALASIQAVMSQMASLTMAFPAVERYVRFCSLAPPAAAETEVVPDRLHVDRITVDSDLTLAGSAPSAVLEPGKATFYVCEWPLSRINIERVARPLVECGTLSWELMRDRACFVGPRAMLPPGPIRSSLLGAEPGGEDEVRVLGWLDYLGVLEELDSLPDGLDTELTPELQEGFSDALKMALVVLPALLEDRPLLLLDMWTIRRAGKEEAGAMLQLLDERIVLLCANGLTLPRDLAETVIVAQDARVAGIGSLEWFETVKGELKSIGKAPAGSVAEEAADVAG